jgi:hypothetical protein
MRNGTDVHMDNEWSALVSNDDVAYSPSSIQSIADGTNIRGIPKWEHKSPEKANVPA